MNSRADLNIFFVFILYKQKMSSMNLASSISELPDINQGLTNSKYVQVAPSRDVTGSNFPNGAQYYSFSVSGSTWWCPSKSYVRLRIKYTAADGTTQLTAASNIAPNEMMCGNLFDSCEFRVGGQTIGRVGENVAQVSAFKYRMSKSKGWLDTIGEQSDFCSADVLKRRSEIVSDGAAALLQDVDVKEGIRESELLRQAAYLDAVWQPPLNIFDVKGCLPAGQFTLVLNPANVSRYQLNAILSDGEKTTADFKFEITDCYFYVATIDGEQVSNKSYALDLHNVECQVQKIEGNGLTQRYFNVSPSTVKLGVAYQDTRINSSTQASASLFTVSDAPVAYGEGILQNDLTRMYISYANMQKPQPDANPEYNEATGVDRLGERYHETLLESGLWWNPAGAESYDDFLKRGLLMLFSFPKSGDDSSTRVQVNQAFKGTTSITNMNVLLFAVSRTAAQITVSNGEIASVELKER